MMLSSDEGVDLDDEDMLKKVFREFDMDGSGQLDRTEIRKGLKLLGLPTSREHVDHVMSECDRDGDFRISFDEFRAFAKTRTQELRQSYDQLSHSSGSLAVGDLRKALQTLNLKASDASLHQLLKRADSNKDGRISFEEYRAFLLFAPGRLPQDLFDYWAKSSAVDIGESMVVADNYSSYQQAAITLTAGAVAGAVSRTATAPMDRLKVILQASAGKGPSSGILAGLRGIYAQGGWRAFWVGNGANVLKIAPETATKFLCYDTLRQRICKDPQDPTMLERLATGASAGAVAQFTIYPLEIAKTRMALSAPGTFTGILNCLNTTAASGGPSALFRGLNASLLGIMPYAGVDLAIYNTLKDNWLKSHPESDSGPSAVTLLGYGAASSTAGQLVAYPLQLVRTRLQAHGMPGMPEFNGVADCFRHILQHDGVTGLYRGIVPNFVKTLPAVAISYTVFESVKSEMNKRTGR